MQNQDIKIAPESTDPNKGGLLQYLKDTGDEKVKIKKEDKDSFLMDTKQNKQEKKESVGQKSILGPVPVIPTFTKLKEITAVETKHEKLMSKIAIITSLTAALFSFGFFYIDLSPTFSLGGSQNTTQRYVAAEEEVIQVEADLILTNILTARLYLDEISVEIDNYFANKKLKDDAKLNIAKTNIKNLLEKIKIKFPSSLSDQDKEKTLEILRNKRESIKENEEEAKNIQNAIKLMQNAELQGLILGADTKKLEAEEFEKFLTDIRNEDKNELSVIASLQTKRINWGEVIKEIEGITSEVDNVFGKGLFEEIGGVTYTGYSFDALSGKITVTGSTKTMDSRTFTLIANLIDAFEKSEKFKNIDKRSFAKSQSDEGFDATLKLDFELEK